MTVKEALENIYTAIHNDNQDIDAHIAQLKTAMGTEKTITVDPARLVQNNRQGRKMMQSYFRKRGIIVEFSS